MQKYIDRENNKFMQSSVEQKGLKGNAVEFGDKVAKLNQIVDYLLLKTSENEEKINSDDKRR